MSLVVLLGWWCAAVGAVSFLPQTVKLVRDRDSHGISLPLWQIILGCTVAWAHHGVLLRAVNMIVPNLLMAAIAGVTLWLVCRDRGVSLVWPFARGLALAAVLAGVDLMFGPVAFGLLVLVPGMAGAVAQLVEIMRAPSLTGVSTAFLVLTLVLQASWLTWGVLVTDASTMINSTMLALVGALTLGAYVVRSRRLVPAVVTRRA